MSDNKRGGFELSQNKKTVIKEGESWFLGIGINEYKEFRDLNNAVKDITDFRDLIADKYGFEEQNISTLFNKEADEENIIDKLEYLAEHTSENDKVIIYYSGHGKVDKWGDGYWLPYDAKQGSTSRYISNSTIRDKIRHIKARHILLIADSCFSGSLLQEGESKSSFSAIEELEAIPSRWALCSGRGDEEVYDGVPGSNSPFTESILNMLRNNMSSAINIVKLFDRVMEVTRANYAQLPQGRPMLGVGHKGGQFVFRPKSEEEKSLWEKTLSDGTVGAFESFLAAFGNGQFAKEAKTKLRNLRDVQAWEKAKNENTITSFAVYLGLHPEGKYRNEAQKAIDNFTQKPAAQAPVNPKVRMQKQLILNGLYNQLSLGGKGNFVIFNINDENESYIQAAGQKGDDSIYIEASTYNIDDKQKAKLEELGWVSPEKTGNMNYSKDYDYHNINDLDPVVDWIYKTFVEVYGLTEDTDVEPLINLE